MRMFPFCRPWKSRESWLYVPESIVRPPTLGRLTSPRDQSELPERGCTGVHPLRSLVSQPPPDGLGR
jgi:hypothetical protein